MFSTESVLAEFAEFCRKADKQEFIATFGSRMGDHLWDKLTNLYHRDFGNLLCALDNWNLCALAQHLNETRAKRLAERS